MKDTLTTNCAQALVRMLELHGVTHVFGIPGAKIDAVFIALSESSIELVTCRHEQNAAMMASAMGKLTGKVGVCLVTSGPGVANLTTGLMTATSEGYPVLAIGGEVAVSERLKATHQSLDGISLLKPVTKYAAEVLSPLDLGEVFGDAVRNAEQGRPGASFISLPKDISLLPYSHDLSKKFGKKINLGGGSQKEITTAANLINNAKKPIVLLGLQSGNQNYCHAIRDFITSAKIPFVSTFQGLGKWADEKNQDLFIGRVGLFSNQPGDKLLNQSDCVITIGYSPIEYDVLLWGENRVGKIINIDVIPSNQDINFIPDAEIIGDIAESLEKLSSLIHPKIDIAYSNEVKSFEKDLEEISNSGIDKNDFPIHPLKIIHELKKFINEKTTVSLDVGSSYIWINRYLQATFPQQFLISNGQQTLGVSIPTAIAAKIVRHDHTVISISGDGAFLFSAMELETAKRINSKFIHIIWDSESYDMVEFQEKAHYKGKSAGVKLGKINIEAFAEAFGFKGINVTSTQHLEAAFIEAFNSNETVIINIPVNYSDNMLLMAEIEKKTIN